MIRRIWSCTIKRWDISNNAAWEAKPKLKKIKN